MDDSAIINLYWQRSEAAIAATSGKYGRYCYSIAYRILRNDQDAEECVNDTYLGAWKSIPPNRPACLSAFLGKITRNAALNRCKREAVEKRGSGEIKLVLSELEDCIPGAAGMEQWIESKALTAVLEQFLYGQPPMRRNIFIRRYWFMDSVGDIAAAYGISASKTASLLFRMRKCLKKDLEKEGIAF